MSIKQLSRSDLTQNTLEPSSTAPIPQWFSKRRMLVLVVLSALFLLLLSSTAMAAATLETTGLSNGIVGEAYSQTLRTSADVVEWDAIGLPGGLTLTTPTTPCTTAVIEGTPTVAGEFEVTVWIGESFHTPISYVFNLSIAPSAPIPDISRPNNTAGFAALLIRDLTDLTDKWYPAVEIDLSTDGLYSIPLVASNRFTIGTGYVIKLGDFILVNFVINGTPESEAFHSFVNGIATEPNPGSDAFQTADALTFRTDLFSWSDIQSNAVGQNGHIVESLKFDVNAFQEWCDKMFGNDQTSPNFQTSQEFLSSTDLRLKAAYQFLMLVGGLGENGLNAGTGSKPLFSFQSKSANGIEMKGGFVTLFKDPKQLTQEAIDDIDTAVANIKRGVSIALPANSGLFGEFIDISGIEGDSPSIWLMPIELVNYQTTSPAIGGIWNSSQPIQQP